MITPTFAVEPGVVIAVAAVVLSISVLAFVLATRLRSTDDQATGRLSSETIDADADAETPVGAVVVGASGREVERAAKLSRSGSSTAVVAAPPAPAPSAYITPDADIIDVTRRRFMNRSIVAFFSIGSLAFLTASVVQFLWPPSTEMVGGRLRAKVGFGGKITTVETLDAILAQLADTRKPYYNATGRFYVQPYPSDPTVLEKARAVYPDAIVEGALANGFVALYQKCPHLGCRVPWCNSSQWFECPCHGSQYNRVGEKRGGPAPAGMFLFPARVNGGKIEVDTGQATPGVPIGTDTTGQGAEGANCV
jgi:cytochrome b6-f complex iron-sulfur subunit